MRLLAWVLGCLLLLCAVAHAWDHLLGNAKCEPPECVAQDARRGEPVIMPAYIAPAPSISR